MAIIKLLITNSNLIPVQLISKLYLFNRNILRTQSFVFKQLIKLFVDNINIDLLIKLASHFFDFYFVNYSKDVCSAVTAASSDLITMLKNLHYLLYNILST